ncbi:unnamed protein product [Orchesella dallaii]|uniref:Uncharacterized protein n=1 Tax=Orchesella dallaii TaxID=48710 RepID=A0ABP1QT06_9HEXA
MYKMIGADDDAVDGSVSQASEKGGGGRKGEVPWEQKTQKSSLSDGHHAYGNPQALPQQSLQAAANFNPMFPPQPVPAQQWYGYPSTSSSSSNQCSSDVLLNTLQTKKKEAVCPYKETVKGVYGGPSFISLPRQASCLTLASNRVFPECRDAGQIRYLPPEAWQRRWEREMCSFRELDERTGVGDLVTVGEESMKRYDRDLGIASKNQPKGRRLVQEEVITSGESEKVVVTKRGRVACKPVRYGQWLHLVKNV